MKQRIKRKATALALLLSFLGGAGWSAASHACSSDPFIGSLCVMAWPRSNSFGNGMYRQADGSSLPVSTYQALYAVIGATYGGTGSSTFQLPDLRGKVVIGAGQNPDSGTVYKVGQKGGAATTTVTLTAAQLPTHNHTLNAGASKPVTTTSTLGSMAATTTLTGLTASTSLSGVTATAAGSGLALNGTTTGTPGTSPAGASLGPTTGSVRPYSDASPSVAMKAGSISGTAPVTFSGNPTTTISGNPVTTLSGAPSVTVSGATDAAGGGQAFGVATMPPYLAMSYYIAANGVFPSPD